jgi:hypothetical protein
LVASCFISAKREEQCALSSSYDNANTSNPLRHSTEYHLKTESQCLLTSCSDYNYRSFLNDKIRTNYELYCRWR